jgi:hypothetical protein
MVPLLPCLAPLVGIGHQPPLPPSASPLPATASSNLFPPAQVNAARTTRRRTYRAHGRIHAYVCTPSTIESIATQKAEQVPKAAGGKSSSSSRLGEGATA